MTTVEESPRHGWRGAWRAAHAPLAGAPPSARLVAHAIPFVVLPSGVWRIATVVFAMAGDGRHHGAADTTAGLPTPVYVTLLSVLSELLAFAAVGLIAPWGEAFPRWVPVLRGRRVPLPDDFPTIALHGWRLGSFLAAYAPLLLWGPLLGLLTVAYWRRRRTPPAPRS
ncbi:hypothetical protein [Streptomyces sp. NBC_00211]|uniref:hypothetical protein n=1 Tax=Streptomyces sp. NBC_00211 TaxID=2975683 RepID=UPI002F9088D3